MKVNGFMHIFTSNNWKPVVLNQINKMKESGLWDDLDKLYVGMVGEEAKKPFFDIKDKNKIEILYTSTKSAHYESLTLSGLYTVAQIENIPLFYIHTKGCSRPYSVYQTDWRNLMEYYIIEKYKSCLRELKTCDIAGVNWHFGDGWMNASKKTSEGVDVTPHFSGNFWWANASYIKRLPPILPINGRYDCEFWIGKANPKVAELWRTGIFHHKRPCPRELYEGKEEVKYI